MTDSRISSQIGLLRRATITRINTGKSSVKIALDLSNSDIGAPIEYNVPIPSPWTGPDGQFMGGSPKVGSSVIVGQAQGGEWFILNYIPSNRVFLNDNDNSSSSTSRNLMSALKEDRWLAQTKNNIRVFGDPNIGIQAGNPNSFIHINPIKNIVSHNFSQELFFTESTRSIKGPIKRDLTPNATRSLTGSILDSQEYDNSLFSVSLDPTTITSIATSGTFTRNPTLVENREITYEFANSFGFTNDIDEANQYTQNVSNKSSNFVNRRESRTDSLSLSLVAPNQLVESIKGTVVDIYGNVLDLNRNVLPLGKINELSFRSNPDKATAFKNLREQIRKSMAFHFEINSRKNVTIPDVSSTADYARDRSRFFMDVDKEGQVKINIPSSSEIGNIPLLTRYENFSTLYSATNGTDPNEFITNVNKIDVFQENFAVNPKIQLVSGSNFLDGYETPIDRITDFPIMFGTAYHDILTTIDARQRPNCCFPFDNNNLLNKLPPYANKIVSDKIIVSGDTANAGGRSASINLDGSLSLNIGANTIDRQSLWLDTAGGIVANVGRDKNNISSAINMDGDLIIQVGGRSTVANDSRFSKLNNAIRSGSIDIRVVKDDGQLTIVRIDSNGGISIATPGRVDIVAGQTIRIKSKGDLLLDAENIVFFADEQGRGRQVMRSGLSI